ncbi:uncharacterized protein LOC133882745 isoform X2 [Alnus glutinosa]|uniref:uncharacterized protein LOC133882745 isoform X2 n=1 Tax=Alnus glutinosa TaxID=3517 RepID=UPI002D76A568|nr:uncharacterized protein LOC133882745 isoform X2 [Alnus glutinosa]
MSVFGGDSWAREGQQRKRRVEDLALEQLDGSSYKRLPSGKYACLICPNSPIIDSPLMFSMHCKGSSHRNAELKIKEQELMRHDEINKRIALSGSSTGTANCNSHHQNFRSVDKPLIEQSRKVASEIRCGQTTQPQQSSSNANRDVQRILDHITNRHSNLSQHSSCPAIEAADKVVKQQQQHLDLQERRERELKFTAAGWKRDGHGKWFRDENVEFDSDEEDPNTCLG